MDDPGGLGDAGLRAADGRGARGDQPKLWAFTMAALGVIAEAGLGQGGSVAAYLAFVVLAESIHLVAVGAMLVAPQRAMPVLDRASDGSRGTAARSWWR